MAGLRFFYAYSLATTHRTIVIESTNNYIYETKITSNMCCTFVRSRVVGTDMDVR